MAYLYAQKRKLKLTAFAVVSFFDVVGRAWSLNTVKFLGFVEQIHIKFH